MVANAQLQNWRCPPKSPSRSAERCLAGFTFNKKCTRQCAKVCCRAGVQTTSRGAASWRSETAALRFSVAARQIQCRCGRSLTEPLPSGRRSPSGRLQRLETFGRNLGRVTFPQTELPLPYSASSSSTGAISGAAGTTGVSAAIFASAAAARAASSSMTSPGITAQDTSVSS